MPIYDLHTHSNHSDGVLSPDELVARAMRKNVSTLALTDHDTTAGLDNAFNACENSGIGFIPGVEISVGWENRTVHIVGLNIDPSDPMLRNGLGRIQSLRVQRANTIEQRLANHGINVGDQARRLANGGTLTRTHFARVLVSEHHAKTLQKAFDRWLSAGKPGYVKSDWTSLKESITWIQHAGGKAVIAHPMRYPWTNAWRSRLFRDFKHAGGDAAEVVGSGLRLDMVRQCAELVTKHDLMGSVGSDFHTPEAHWIELGRLAPLPSGIKPIWSAWQ